MQPREQGDTGVDVGSNEIARTSADPGRLRGRCLAARGLAAGLLVAVAALLDPAAAGRGPEDHLRLQHRSEHRIPMPPGQSVPHGIGSLWQLPSTAVQDRRQ